MSTVTREPCRLCHDVEFAVDPVVAEQLRTEFEGYGEGPEFASFVSGGKSLLHHACRSPQAVADVRWWNENRSWWACLRPSRDLDDDAFFDVACRDCAERWVSSTGTSLG